jgi:hypothetical protein
LFRVPWRTKFVKLRRVSADWHKLSARKTEPRTPQVLDKLRKDHTVVCKNTAWSVEVKKPFGGVRAYESLGVIKTVIENRSEPLVQFGEIELRISPKS